MKKYDQLLAEYLQLKTYMKNIQKNNKLFTDALIMACDELSKYKIGNACLLCNPRCKMKCKAMDWKGCSTRLQIHFLEEAKYKEEQEDDTSTNNRE